jgi:hypothetical protein
VAALALALLAGMLLAEPSALRTGLALAVLAGFWTARKPADLLLALVPFAAIANLETWMPDAPAVYPSELILLAAVAVVALRHPSVFDFQGAARIALTYGAWVALAAIAAAGISSEGASWSDASRLIRSGFLAASLAALGHSLAGVENGARLWSRAALGAAAVLGALAIAETLPALRSGALQTGRIVGGSELLALHLTLLLPPALVAATGGGSRFRVTGLVLLALGATGLVVSFSRSGWVGGMVSIAGMAVLALATQRHRGRLLAAVAALALAVAFVVVVGIVAGSGDGELARAYGDRVRSLVGPDLFSDRAEAWRLGVEAVRAHPWIGRPDAPNPYNLALDLAAKSGLAALVLFGCFVASGLASGIRAAMRNDAVAPFALGLCGAAIALLVTGVGESTLGARLTPVVFTTLGLLAGVGKHGATPAR